MMKECNEHIKKYLGYKFFKEVEEDKFDVIRITKIHSMLENKINIQNEDTEEVRRNIDINTITDYTPLEPYGVVCFSIVRSKDESSPNGYMEDVIVSLYKLLDLKLGNNTPYAICRQGVTDFFHTMIASENVPFMAGVSVSIDTCPPNVPYQELTACDEVVDMKMVHFYRDDTLDDILNCIPLSRYDKVLETLYRQHCDTLVSSIVTFGKESHMGWCKNLKRLLIENNFMADFNTMCSITQVDFDLSDYIIENENGDSLSRDVEVFLSKAFQVNIDHTMVIKYDYDIDLADFNHSNYILLKDKTNTLYIIVYMTDGKFFEKELEEEAMKLDVSDKFKLSFFNKYDQVKR